MLVHHVRQDGVFIGTVVAIDKDVVGWSQCCTKDRTKQTDDDFWDVEDIPADKFDKALGIKIAEGRAMNGGKSEPTHDWRGVLLRESLEKIRLRSQRYFKISPHEFQQVEMEKVKEKHRQRTLSFMDEDADDIW